MDCNICMTFIEDDIYSTTCGHLFCKKCINKMILISQKCWNCQQPLNEAQTHKIYMSSLSRRSFVTIECQFCSKHVHDLIYSTFCGHLFCLECKDKVMNEGRCKVCKEVQPKKYIKFPVKTLKSAIKTEEVIAIFNERLDQLEQCHRELKELTDGARVLYEGWKFVGDKLITFLILIIIIIGIMSSRSFQHNLLAYIDYFNPKK